MPSRIIKESIKTSKNVNALSDFQFRLWIHLIVSADDFGRGNADPELIKNLAFPRRKGVTEKQLADALHVLANMGMVNLYEVDGEPYFYFPKWSEHQRVRQKVSKYPEPDEENALTADCGELPQIAADCGEMRPEARSENTEARIQNMKREYRVPTREEVHAYAKERDSCVDPDRFYDYFDIGNWKDSNGKPVQNWRQKFITWERRETHGRGSDHDGVKDSPSAGAEKWGDLYNA